MKVAQPFFSIVIPTLNEEKFLPSLLADLTQQTYASFEVIVVDGSSEDKTVDKVKTFTPELSLTLLETTTRNVSFQRNMGGARARGEWVIFMDADNRLPVYFLDGIRYQIAKFPETDLFTTYTKLDSTQTVDQAIENVINWGIELYRIMGNPQGFGALIGCRKIVLDHVNFDEQQKVLEDSLFLKEAHALGFHFSIFKEPAFIFSMRRFKKEGTVKLLRSAAGLQMKYLTGQDVNEDEDKYPMLGGSYYQASKPKEPLLDSIQEFLKSASKKQLSYAQKVLTALKDRA